MGRQQHSKDRMFITATEWSQDFGGHKKKREGKIEGALPFECCALNLRPFETPMCTRDGVIFDMLAIVPFVKEHSKSPVTGKKCGTKDLIRLNMAKNQDGAWHCPVTCKVFTNFSKVVCVSTTGNVYAHEAVHELCVKRDDLKDLIDSTPFKRSDLVWLHDPDDSALCARRDLANFVHLREERERHAAAQESGTAHRDNIRTADSVDAVLAAARGNVKVADEKRAAKERKDAMDDSSERNVGMTDAFKRVRLLAPTTDDVCKGSMLTTAATSGSLTSTIMDVSVSSSLRAADELELRAARWKTLRGLGKKGYVQLRTSLGDVNVEVHCDVVPRAAENFLTHCANKYYDGLTFHRVMGDFMAQGGDPKGDGTGGASIWGGEFDDEFDSRLLHDGCGVLAYANSGRNKNKSQFYICFRAAAHLDNKHTVFGKVVGGMETLTRMQRADVDASDDHRPRFDIKIESATVFVNPIAEADAKFEADAIQAVSRRAASKPTARAPAVKRPVGPVNVAIRDAPHSSSTVGKYLSKRPAAPADDQLDQHAAVKKIKAPKPGGFSFDSW
ncbi:hypothetical protein M885DRAFT_510154 [Pelagophyceae sp. CCMP2097]|nr:hypothetical protein M885DRAFT_510154 [Pelagophyceae sp. CCMP2097]|mmetsp:Transcript_22793/g.77086  ORF Transcript_22793/g.77086 Transcript_22793/m.77086 type:complete len:559 (-) Transcript_22793:31-1707(-)